MKKVALMFCAVAASLVSAVAAHSQESDNVETFMLRKLAHAQKVLEGLATEDFDSIAKNAQELSLLSQATQWQVLQTPEYVRRSAEFRRAADELKSSAQEKNLDGATLAYVNVTIKCVECHKYVRRVRNAQLDLPDSREFDAFQLRR